MDAVILAAGRGQRLSGITAPFFKPLLTVNGAPLISQAVRHAQDVCDGRVIVVCAPGNVQPIAQVLDDGNAFQDVELTVQITPRGPGHALMRGLLSVRSDRTLVLCADNLFHRRDLERVVEVTDGLVVGVRIVRSPAEAEAFTRVTQTHKFIEGTPGGRWDDNTYRCWMGPLILPTERAKAVYDRAFHGELKIGPLLNDFNTRVHLVPVDVYDIGSTDATVRADLHAQVDQINFNMWQMFPLLHALIDLGVVSVLECQADTCQWKDRSFDPFSSGRSGQRSRVLTLDHELPVSQGGDHSLTNLRIYHMSCNAARNRGYEHHNATRKLAYTSLSVPEALS